MSYNSNLIIVVDTETSGFSPEKNEVVQLSYILYDIQKKEVVYATKPEEDIVKIKGEIPVKLSNKVHGITKDMTLDKRPIREHLDEFINYCNKASKFVGHNIKFDINMISGEMNKIIKEFPETESTYKIFLDRFQTVGNKLPEDVYCTMMESQSICAEILKTKKLKNKKLKEVHKLLFNQDVGGQLHNALVDISVTLRIYLKLTMDIDICESMAEFSSNVESVKNNYTICSLIKPIPVSDPVPISVDYTGELITGLNIIPGALEEEKVMVQTISKQIVSQVTKQAISNVTSKLVSEGTMCTNIIICKAILKSGKRQGDVCSYPLKGDAEFCRYHRPKGKKVQPEQVNDEFTLKPTPKPYSKYNWLSFTKKNKIVPEGGKRRSYKKHKGKRKTYLRYSKRRYNKKFLIKT
jgi:DNA polymerase III epsilon subunit-like protein